MRMLTKEMVTLFRIVILKIGSQVITSMSKWQFLLDSSCRRHQGFVCEVSHIQEGWQNTPKIKGVRRSFPCVSRFVPARSCIGWFVFAFEKRCVHSGIREGFLVSLMCYHWYVIIDERFWEMCGCVNGFVEALVAPIKWWKALRFSIERYYSGWKLWLLLVWIDVVFSISMICCW